MVSCARALYHAGAAKSHQLQWRGGVGGFPDDDLLCPRYNVVTLMFIWYDTHHFRFESLGHWRQWDGLNFQLKDGPYLQLAEECQES